MSPCGVVCSHIVSLAALSLLMTGTDGGQTHADGVRLEMNGKHKEGKAVRAEKILASAVTIDGRMEWFCKFCSETNVWTRCRCRRCKTNIPSGLQGKYKPAVSAKAGVCSSRSSSSSGGKNKRSREPEAETRELREELQRYKSMEKEARNSVRICRWRMWARRRLERWKLVKRLRRSWISERKSCKNSCETFTGSQIYRKTQEVFQEKWQQELQDIEQRRHDLLPEHQKLQKRFQNLQSLQDRKIRVLQAGEDRRGSCATQSNGCCIDPALVEQLFTLGAAQAWQQIQAIQEEFKKKDLRCCFKPQSLRYTRRGEKKEETIMRRSKCKEQLAAKWVSQLQRAAHKGFWLVLFLDPARFQGAKW